MSSALFEALRERASAHDVLALVGVPVIERGRRSWACCPIHGEKTPSLCIYEDGRWHCFGCHAHGDAVDLYAALYNLAPGEAARELAGKLGITDEPGRYHAPRQRWDRSFRRRTRAEIERRRSQVYGVFADAARRAEDDAARLADWDNPAFVAALRAKSAAEIECEQALLADEADLFEDVTHA